MCLWGFQQPALADSGQCCGRKWGVLHTRRYTVRSAGHPVMPVLETHVLMLTMVLAVGQSSEDASVYEWGPQGLRVFETLTPEAGSDVAAIKAGHVSLTPLKAGFLSGA